VLSHQTRKPLEVGNLPFKQIFDSDSFFFLCVCVCVCVCVRTETQAYQLLKQSAMQERLQSSEEEEEEDDDDGLSGKGCGPLYQATSEQREPNHRSTPDLMSSHNHSGTIFCVFINVSDKQSIQVFSTFFF